MESDNSTAIQVAIAKLTGRLELAKAIVGSRRTLRRLFNSVMIPPTKFGYAALVARKSLRSAGNLNAAADLIPLSAKNPCQEPQCLTVRASVGRAAKGSPRA